jgi:hypothetical protein
MCRQPPFTVYGAMVWTPLTMYGLKPGNQFGIQGIRSLIRTLGDSIRRQARPRGYRSIEL